VMRFVMSFLQMRFPEKRRDSPGHSRVSSRLTES
jgi:hypothetical protein